MLRRTIGTTVLGPVVTLLWSVACHAQAEGGRIGFAEEFDTLDGWKVTSGGTLESMRSLNGVAVFDTCIGLLFQTWNPSGLARPIVALKSAVDKIRKCL